MALSSIRQVSDLDTGQEKEEEAGESKAEQKESQEKNYYFHIQIMASGMIVVYGGSYPKNEKGAVKEGFDRALTRRFSMSRKHTYDRDYGSREAGVWQGGEKGWGSDL